MHIVHVIDTLDPAHGGPPAVAENLAKAQAALGHDVRLGIQVGDASQVVPTVTLPPHSFLHLFRRPQTEVIALVQQADVLHLHGVWEPLLAGTARAARNAGRPYVITPHGMLDPWSLSQGKWKKRLALALGFRQMLNGAGALHVLNADEQRLLARLQLNAPCEVITNGIFLDKLDPPPNPALFRSRRPGPGDRSYILFLSRLHYKKGLDILADAFALIAAKHPNVDLVVAGPDGGEEQPFRQRIAQLGLTSRTWITGPLYGADKWSALGGANVFCLPSRQEGFSVAILEAMACSVPVVVSEDCHFPEVADFGAGMVVRLDASAVAAGLDTVLSNAAAGRAIGTAGRALVEKRFTWPKIAAQTLQMYERLLQNHAAR
jgi:glycosyltransferase involved in cell wall biosynthesis